MGVSNIGLICGAEVARILVKELKRLRFEVKAVWTNDLTFTVSTASEFEICFAATTADEVLLRKEVQLLIICGVPHLHSRVSVKALGIGKHVLSHSPGIGLTLSDSNKMVTAALYYPQLISLAGLTLRQLPVFRKLKELLNKSVVGSVDLVEVKVESSSLINDQYDWLCESRMGGGALNLLGTQLIDVCQFVLNRKAQRVSATLRNSHKPSINGIYTVDADDFCVLTIWLDNGCLVTITINCNFPMIKYSHEISLFGEKGWIRVKDNKIELYQHGNSGVNCGPDEDQPAYDTTFGTIFCGFQALLANLRKAIDDISISGKSWQTGSLADSASFIDGKQIREVIEAAVLSNASGVCVKIGEID